MALPAGEIEQAKYNFLNTIDTILVDFYKPISENNFGSIFDSDVYLLYAAFKKPIIIGISTGSDDLIEQAETYNSALSAVSERAWINGVISQGYKPSVIVKNASSSIFGKPAMDVLSYYFNQVILN